MDILPMKSIDHLRAELRAHLLSYGRSPSAAAATHVVHCLERLVLHPDFHADLGERCICKQRLTFWRLLAEPGPVQCAAWHE
jgi:hypothetical protein